VGVKKQRTMVMLAVVFVTHFLDVSMDRLSLEWMLICSCWWSDNQPQFLTFGTC